MIINVEKSTGLVRDIGQNFDDRFFDNADFPDGTIPNGDNPRFYRRVSGNIVKLSQAEIEANQPSEMARRLRADWQTAIAGLVADVQALPAGPQKQILGKLLQTMRLMAQLVKFE